VRSTTTGNVSFLFTDIEGSTRLWEEKPEAMRQALARHDALVRAAVESNRGTVVKMIGDGVHAAFDDPLAALSATLAIQCALVDPSTTNGVALRVRCGLHVGVVERRDNDYFGSPVNRAARIVSVAHGGQILLSQAMVDCVREHLPARISLRDLGRVRLKDLATPEHVYQLVHPQLRQDFPALRSLEATPNNLPQQLTSFIGRERDLADVKRLLAQNRLLTLVGAGGIGKTRLSLQVAADTLDAYPDGVWLVEFGAITDPLLVPTSVAQVLGVQERPDTTVTYTLCSHLKSRQLLLVLDNCEHLIDACATLADALLAEAPRVRILASSRQPLQVGGEQRFALPPLSLPQFDASPESLARAEAVQLLIERARLQQPGLVLTERNAHAVAQLCAHLDGIPLALELAASRMGLLSIDEINAHLNDRFKLLASGHRTSLPHHQTLRATLDWSYGLLGERERALFRRLSVFAGAFALSALSVVVADDAIDEFDAIELLSHLVERSLVVADTNDVRTRYRLLETTRAYALEKLAQAGEADAVVRWHARYFCDVFEHAFDDWMRLPDAGWRGSYLSEIDNVRAALDWAMGVGGDPSIGLALASSSGVIWLELTLRNEGRQRLEAAVARIGTRTPKTNQARLWFWLGSLYGTALPVQAVATLERAVNLYRHLGDALGFGCALVRLGGALAFMGRFDKAAPVLAEAFSALERTGVPKALAGYFDILSMLKMQAGNPTDARMHLESALSLYRKAGAESNALSVLANLADIAWALGDLDAALNGFRETVTLMRKSPLITRSNLGTELLNLAGVHTERGELDQALTAAREGLPAVAEMGYTWHYMDHIALCAALGGKVTSAARLAGLADSTFVAKETSRQANEARARDRLHALLREKLTPHALERLLAEGTKMTEDEACRLALED
jgi:predicted ATPase/class 3 adenylate cyclase